MTSRPATSERRCPALELQQVERVVHIPRVPARITWMRRSASTTGVGAEPVGLSAGAVPVAKPCAARRLLADAREVVVAHAGGEGGP